MVSGGAVFYRDGRVWRTQLAELSEAVEVLWLSLSMWLVSSDYRLTNTALFTVLFHSVLQHHRLSMLIVIVYVWFFGFFSQCCNAVQLHEAFKGVVHQEIKIVIVFSVKHQMLIHTAQVHSMKIKGHLFCLVLESIIKVVRMTCALYSVFSEVV